MLLSAIFGLKYMIMEFENYVTDKKGKKIAVQLPIKIYEKLLADSEELDEIKEYRKAKKHKSEAISFEQAFKEIEDSLK
jgi:transcriptional regulator of met regulon